MSIEVNVVKRFVVAVPGCEPVTVLKQDLPLLDALWVSTAEGVNVPPLMEVISASGLSLAFLRAVKREAKKSVDGSNNPFRHW